MKLSKLHATANDVMSWKPCDPPYTEARVHELFAGREHLTALEILDLDIPPEDRLWAALREELIDARTLRLYACGEAELVLDRAEECGEQIDPRSRKAISVSRRYARGQATVEELIAARGAAWYITRDAAWTAARDTAWAAAWDAAWTAAWATAWYTAWTAARATAEKASRDAQVKRLRKMIEEVTP